ncbi:unnamed protein product [Ixodes pacificus]
MDIHRAPKFPSFYTLSVGTNWPRGNPTLCSFIDKRANLIWRAKRSVSHTGSENSTVVADNKLCFRVMRNEQLPYFHCDLQMVKCWCREPCILANFTGINIAASNRSVNLFISFATRVYTPKTLRGSG